MQVHRMDRPESPGIEASMRLLLYDNQFVAGLPLKPTHLLYRSAEHLGVPYHVGSLAHASERPWLAGDREEWLMRVLPEQTASLVMLLDATDAALFCGPEELAAKWRALAGYAANGRGRVLIGVEQQLWPEEQTFVIGGRRAHYPRSSIGHVTVRRGPSRHIGTPFRFINIGMLAGPPVEVLGLLRCMQDQYPGFPRQCPGVRRDNGSYEWFSNAPHRTKRFGIFSGHWGWEQACFHTYYFEQMHNQLPSHCPELALDYKADVIFNLKKSIDFLVLRPWQRGQRPRMNGTWYPSLNDSRPCVLHANSATRAVLPVVDLFWNHAHGKLGSSIGNSSGDTAPSMRDLAQTVVQWRSSLVNRSLNPCITAARHSMGMSEVHARRACNPPLQRGESVVGT